MALVGVSSLPDGVMVLMDAVSGAVAAAFCWGVLGCSPSSSESSSQPMESSAF